MGRRDPERQQAIEAELAVMRATRDEEITELLAVCDVEDSQAIMDENEFMERVNRIEAENKRFGITPTAWFCSLQWPSTEECRIRDELIERWETDMMTQADIDDRNDDFVDMWSGPAIPMEAVLFLTDGEPVDWPTAQAALKPGDNPAVTTYGPEDL